jgi:adenylate kinase
MIEKKLNMIRQDRKIPVSVVFLGPPASGKGTAASYLKDKHKIGSVSPGNIFKKIRSENSDLAKLVIESTKDGGLCPDWITNQVVLQEAENLISNGAKSITLDGFPRTEEQLLFLNENYDVGLFVYASTHWMTLRKMVSCRRICKTCSKVFSTKDLPNCNDFMSDFCAIKSENNWEQRWDDNPEFFAKRFKVYKKETLPVIKEVSKYSNFIKLDLLKNENYKIIESYLKLFL